MISRWTYFQVLASSSLLFLLIQPNLSAHIASRNQNILEESAPQSDNVQEEAEPDSGSSSFTLVNIVYSLWRFGFTEDKVQNDSEDSASASIEDQLDLFDDDDDLSNAPVTISVTKGQGTYSSNSEDQCSIEFGEQLCKGETNIIIGEDEDEYGMKQMRSNNELNLQITKNLQPKKLNIPIEL